MNTPLARIREILVDGVELLNDHGHLSETETDDARRYIADLEQRDYEEF